LSEEYCAHRTQISKEMFKMIGNDADFLRKIIFPNEVTFHVKGAMNRIMRCCLLFTEKKIIVQIVMTFPKLYGPFLFRYTVRK